MKVLCWFYKSMQNWLVGIFKQYCYLVLLGHRLTGVNGRIQQSKNSLLSTDTCQEEKNANWVGTGLKLRSLLHYHVN